MHEKTKVVFVGMWSWKRAEIVFTHGLDLRCQKQVQFRLLMLVKCLECASSNRESYLVSVNLINKLILVG